MTEHGLTGNFYRDTVLHDPLSLRLMIDLVSAERVVSGSEYPFEMGEADQVGRVRSSGVADGDVEEILSENAGRLFGLETTWV